MICKPGRINCCQEKQRAKTAKWEVIGLMGLLSIDERGQENPRARNTSSTFPRLSRHNTPKRIFQIERRVSLSQQKLDLVTRSHSPPLPPPHPPQKKKKINELNHKSSREDRKDLSEPLFGSPNRAFPVREISSASVGLARAVFPLPPLGLSRWGGVREPKLRKMCERSSKKLNRLD